MLPEMILEAGILSNRTGSYWIDPTKSNCGIIGLKNRNNGVTYIPKLYT